MMDRLDAFLQVADDLREKNGLPPLPEDFSPYFTSRIESAFPGVRAWKFVVCPWCGRDFVGRSTFMKIIPHLNDDHKLSRYQIADWLDSLPTDFSISEEYVYARECKNQAQ